MTNRDDGLSCALESMPTYSYRCDACGRGFEREQRISEDPVKKCPRCGKRKARRMISGGSFILKGGGWYSDGYGSTKPPAPEPVDSESSSSSSSSSDTKSDKKSEKSDKKSDKKSEGGKSSKKAASAK